MSLSEKSPDFLLDRLQQNAQRYPDKTAISFLSSSGKVEDQLTYSELEQATTDIASRLFESGLAQGDR